MVKVLENNGYRFYIYSNDHPPIHIHVLKADSEAKINFRTRYIDQIKLWF
ncbi:DUF4160 domain-containing protein [Aquiflexum balticum]